MDQMTFPFDHDEHSLKTFLERMTGKAISLVLTDNSTSMLSMKKRGRSVSMRVHRMFLSAGAEVLEEMGCYIKNSAIRTPRIRDFINGNVHQLRKGTPRKMNLKVQGRHFNLRELFQTVNAEYFDSRIMASITWGAKGTKRGAACRTLGSYCAENNTIRINPALDTRRVPRYFVEFVVYHEMLHADMGIRKNGNRRSIHPKEFKRRERMFRHYSRAIDWEKKR